MILAALALTAAAQNHAFPSTASDYGHWYLSTYFDHGGADYACGTDRYSGHTGTDYGAGSWAGMAAGRDIAAAADGVVQYVHDGERDDCASDCSSGANFVQIQHADGHLSTYGHLKRWSITVSVGDSVDCGDKIGEMGSSGNSSGPHLHFGVYANGTMQDPYSGQCNPVATQWVDQGSYQSLPGLVCDSSSGLGGGGGGGCGSMMFDGHLAFLLLPPTLLWRRRRVLRRA